MVQSYSNLSCLQGKGRMDTYWLIDRMYGGTGGPNAEDYSKDARLQNDERYVTDRPVEPNTGNCLDGKVSLRKLIRFLLAIHDPNIPQARRHWSLNLILKSDTISVGLNKLT